jgi:hypothetical protein
MRFQKVAMEVDGNRDRDMRGANQRTSLSVSRLFCCDAYARYGFFVAVGFGGGTFVFVFADGLFVLAGGARFAGFDVFAGVFAGLFMFSFVAVLQPTAKAPRAKVANSAAIFDLVMKPPLLVSYRALEKNRCSMIS